MDTTPNSQQSGTGPTDEVARLRAADPARDAVADPVALRAAVDARLAADAAAAGAPDELSAARERRRMTWLPRIAGIAAATLVVGGGGYALGAQNEAPALTAAPMIELASDGAGGQDAAAESSVAGGGAPAVGPMASAAADERVAGMSWWGWGRTVFTSSGLSEAGGSGRAWALDATGVVNEATVTAAAAALGVAGTAQQLDGTWMVGPNDGTAASVSMYPDGTGSLSYYDPAKDPWSCGVVTMQEGGDAATSDLVEPGGCEQRDLGPAPSAEDAASRLRDLLGALGVDAAGYELVSEDWSDAQWTYVTAYQVVDGQRSGLSWSATFTGAGLHSLYGSLAPLVELGEYDVVSPAEAVERLGDPRFGAGGGPIAWAQDAVARSEMVEPMPVTPTVPPAVTPGSQLSWPVAEVTIVSARLGVAVHTQADGAVVLAPTYELTSADGGVWSVIAVVDEALDMSTQG